MRISDWSSDVCSSDLRHDAGLLELAYDAYPGHPAGPQLLDGAPQAAHRWFSGTLQAALLTAGQVTVLGDIRQVQKIAEGARDRVDLMVSQPADLLGQDPAVAMLTLAAKPDGGAAQFFDDIVDWTPLAFAQDFAQCLAQQPDILPQQRRGFGQRCGVKRSEERRVGKRVSVRGAIGGRRISKKKQGN